MVFFFFSSRRRHTRCSRDWSSDVCSSDLQLTCVYDPSVGTQGGDTGYREQGRAQGYAPTDRGSEADDQPLGSIKRDPPSLRRWNRHHVWGLHQLYRATTPQRVQMAEMLENSEELAKLYVG